jgi:hypothetical protein
MTETFSARGCSGVNAGGWPFLAGTSLVPRSEYWLTENEWSRIDGFYLITVPPPPGGMLLFLQASAMINDRLSQINHSFVRWWRHIVMNKRKYRYISGLVLACVCYGNILKAGPVEEACEIAHMRLNSITGGFLHRKEAEFVYLDNRYKGCILTLNGDISRLKGDYNPADIFLPF